MGYLGLIALTVFFGALGGIASRVMLDFPAEALDGVAPNQLPAATPVSWLGHAFLGVVAALTVPLFLSFVQSQIVVAIATADSEGTGGITDDIMIYVGFCVVAAFSFRRFLTSVTDRTFALEKKVEQRLEKIETKVEDVADTVDETADNLPDQPAPEAVTAPLDQNAQPVAPLTKADLPPEAPDILGSIIDSRFARRSSRNVAKELGMDKNQVGRILDEMAAKNLVLTKVSRKTGATLYEPTKTAVSIVKA